MDFNIKYEWNESKYLLPEMNVVAYIDYLNKFLVTIDSDQTDKIDIGSLYYFNNTTQNIFPKEFNNRWILCRLYRVFPSSMSILKNPWQPKTGGVVTKFTCNYWFWIDKVYDSEEELLHKTRLRGFNKVIDDNRYFDAIPKINEITHVDNGIISNSKVTVDASISTDPNKWDIFRITHTTEIDKTFSLLKMLKREHEEPER